MPSLDFGTRLIEIALLYAREIGYAPRNEWPGTHTSHYSRLAEDLYPTLGNPAILEETRKKCLLATGQLTQVKFCSERASHGEARPRQQMSDEFESANQLCGVIKQTYKTGINQCFICTEPVNHKREIIAGPAGGTMLEHMA